MKLRNFVSTTFLVALLTVVLFVGIWQTRPAQAVADWMDGFEDGDGYLPNWGGTVVSGGTIAIDQVFPYQGVNCSKSIAQNNGQYARAYKIAGDKTYFFACGTFNFSAGPDTANEYIAPIRISNDWGAGSTTLAYALLINDGGTVKYGFGYTDGSAWHYYNGSTTVDYLVDTTWEVAYYPHASLGNMTLWIDGVEEISVTSVDTSDGSNADRGDFGIAYVSGNQASAITVYADRCGISSSYIGIATTQNPTYYQNSIWVNTTTANTVALFSTKFEVVDDEATGVTLSFGVFEHNNTGSLANTTTAFTGGTVEWFNKTITLAPAYTQLKWRMCANDSNNNWVTTPWFYVYSTTVEPWDTTSGNQIQRNGTTFIPRGYFIERSAETPTWVLEPKGSTSPDNWYASFSENAFRDNAKAWTLQNVTLIGVYPCMENWALDNNHTNSPIYFPEVNATSGRNILTNQVNWLAEYSIALSIRFYMLTYAEGRPAMPYPPSHDGSLISSEYDFIDQYLAFAVNMSSHPNVWFHPFDEPTVNHANWFTTLSNLTMQMRGAGIHHIFQIQWGYCGDVQTYGDAWAVGTTTLNHTKNIVFAPHIYRYHGSFGAEAGGEPQAAYTYADIYQIMVVNTTGTCARGYYYLKNTLGFPIIIGAVGAYHFSDPTIWDYELQAYNNTLAVCTDLGIGYCAYTWQRMTTFRLSNSGNALRYPDSAGIYALQYFNTQPWVFSVGNETASGYSNYYIYSNNTAWTQSWNPATGRLTVTYTFPCQVRVFWNVSSTYTLDSSIKAYNSNNTLIDAEDCYDPTTNLIRLNCTDAGGSWIIGPTITSTPTYVSHTFSTTVSGANCTIEVSWTDTGLLAYGWLTCNVTGTDVNTTARALTGSADTFTEYVALNVHENDVLTFTFYANNTGGTVTVTPQYTLIITVTDWGGYWGRWWGYP